jgi:transposase-like protein
MPVVPDCADQTNYVMNSSLFGNDMGELRSFIGPSPEEPREPRAHLDKKTAAREHLEALRWSEGPFCPHCGSVAAKRLPAQRERPTKAHPEGAVLEGVIQCNDCRRQYSVTVDTVFESSKIALHKWVLATYMLTCSKKGMSAHQLHRMIGVTYKTAWFMVHRIREAMREGGICYAVRFWR